jgi:ATP-dependent Lhr-like helicase
MEMRGDVRRGYFVRGLSGVQFALPDVVERLRMIRDSVEDVSTLVVMNACDPANLYGPTREDGPETARGEPLAFARVPFTWLVQDRGLPVIVAQDSGVHMTTVQGAHDELVGSALRALVNHLSHFTYQVRIETWNGSPVLGGPGQGILQAVGFRRDYPGMTYETRPSVGRV